MTCRLPVMLLCALLAGPALAQDKPQPDIKALWETGCLWEVGDNPPRVKKAREELIALGEPALQHALTRLEAANTLETRCLSAVFGGWKEAPAMKDKAFDALVANIAHEKPAARRNVADLLAQLGNRNAGKALLAQAGVETNDAARIAQLTALSDWNIEGTLPVLLEASRCNNDRARGRTAVLLAGQVHPQATLRLVNMMAEPTYHVADAALAAMKGAPVESREACLTHLSENLDLPAAQRNTPFLRRLLAVAPGVALPKTPGLILRALAHDDAGVRADAALALVAWKGGAGLLDDKVDVAAELNAALGRESDPFARTELKRALETLSKIAISKTGKSG